MHMIIRLMIINKARHNNDHHTIATSYHLPHEMRVDYSKRDKSLKFLYYLPWLNRHREIGLPEDLGHSIASKWVPSSAPGSRWTSRERTRWQVDASSSSHQWAWLRSPRQCIVGNMLTTPHSEVRMRWTMGGTRERMDRGWGGGKGSGRSR